MNQFLRWMSNLQKPAFKLRMGMKNDQLTVEFWGVRGTLPVTGRDSLRYGGNTSCVTLNITNKPLFIFDAGIGIKKLSDHLIKNKISPLNAKILISHPHWDHINGLPYFAPIYEKGNTFEILCPCEKDKSLERLVFNQMDGVHFPVTPRQFLAKLSYHALQIGSFYINDIFIRTMRLNHPGMCLGYRIEYNNKSFCYITDNELVLKNTKDYKPEYEAELVSFIHDADMLIIDSTYTDEQYAQKISWGHSCISQVIDVADQAKVKLLCLYHHDPSQTDNDIDLKLKTAQSLLALRHSITKCIAPCEGGKYTL